MAMPGPGLGLQQLTDGIWRSYQKPGLDGTKITAARLFVDREGSLWIGTLQQGIFRVHGQKVEHFTSADGLSGDFVRSLYEDREGNLWVVTSKGVDLFRDLRVASFSTREGIGTEEVESVLASRDGTIWVGGAESLDAIRNDGVSSVRSGKGLPGGQVGALFEDHAGNLWVGVDQKLFIYKNQIFKPITRSDGSPVGSVKSVTEDGDNNIWVSTWHGLVRSVLRIRDFKVQEELPNSQIPPSRQVIADSQRNLWLAPLNGGLARFNNGQIETIAFEGMKDSRIEQLIIASDGSVLGATEAGVVAWKNNIRRTLTVQNGLPCNGAHGIINDAQGNLWLNLRCGLVKVTDVELKKWWENSDPLHPRVFDTFDGAQAGRAFWSSAARSTDGRLWFANGTVLQMIDPAHIPVNYVAPPVHVERIIADRNTYLPQNGVTVPPLTRDLEIDYAALSFGVPQKVLFRYKLEGRDTNWIEAATRRQAFYNDLRPGRYRFRVIACNNDGLWNEAGASLDFSILPAYYQTTWFRMACAVASLVLLWAIYQFRVRQLHRQFAIGMEARVNERTRIAQDLHDTLLQGFISASMQLGVADRQLPADWPAKSIVTDVLNLMRDVIEEGRKAVRGMRLSSEDSDDLERAFLRIPQELVVQRSVGFRVLVEGQVRSLHPLIRDEVYRIGREALVNAFRHSQAASIEVELEYADRELRVLVRDNGCGIDPQVLQSGREGHWGLSGMRERAGRIDARLKVWSDAAAGTEIELSVPSRFAYRLDASLRGLRWFAGFGRRKGGDHAQKPGNER
jgi:signal transduction histidine kinase/streptogramin lyase